MQLRAAENDALATVQSTALDDDARAVSDHRAMRFSRARCTSRIRNTARALPRAKDVVSEKNDVAIVATLAPFLNDHRGNHRARTMPRDLDRKNEKPR